jgi:hypothetical protein
VASGFQGVAELVRARALRLGERKIPVEIRVLESQRQPAGLTLGAWPFGRGVLAQEELAEPESESLLSDATGAAEDDALRQGAGSKRAGQ